MIENKRIEILNTVNNLEIIITPTLNSGVLTCLYFICMIPLLVYDKFFPNLFNLPVLVIFLILVFEILWQFFGEERLFLNNNKIYIEKKIFDYGLKTEINLIEVKDFKIPKDDIEVAMEYQTKRYILEFLQKGKIEIQTINKNYTFGKFINDKDAKFLINEIKNKLNKSS